MNLSLDRLFTEKYDAKKRWPSDKFKENFENGVKLTHIHLVNVSKQKHLRITIDSNLIWAYHVAYICKKMAYYLYHLISYHQKVVSYVFPLIDSFVFSHFVHGLPVSLCYSITQSWAVYDIWFTCM